MKIWLAPMEGVVDSIMRDVLTSVGGIDACVTEFMRITDRLQPDHVFYRYAPELAYESRTRAGTSLYFQLLGGQADPLAENARRAAELGATGIDLNFGCPAKTVNRHDGGATLLKTPQRVFDIVKAVRASTPAQITVSAKLRLGFDDKSLFLENAQAASDAGAAWLTIHARTKAEMYRPPAHWEYIARIREGVKVPVIANGEIWTVEDAVRCREVSGCRDIMIGRGLIARPSLAREIHEHFLTGTSHTKLLFHEIKPLLQTFAQKSAKEKGPAFAEARIKQWVKQLARTYPEAQLLFDRIKTSHDYNLILSMIEAPFNPIFDSTLKPLTASELTA